VILNTHIQTFCHEFYQTITVLAVIMSDNQKHNHSQKILPAWQCCLFTAQKTSFSLTS